MSGLSWRDVYETGDMTVDRQHMAMFAVINELHDAIRTGRGDELVNQTLIELIRYARTHFEDEESLMESVGYPRLEEHRLAHSRLAGKVRELAAEPDRAHPLLLSVFCYDWLIGHIRAHDMPMINYVRACEPCLGATA